MLIAFLGLFGLVGYSVRKKTKEIGIRKVLGATTFQVLNHISMGFLRIIGLATLVAIPFAWFGMNSWLGTFPYRIDLNPGYFLFSILALLIGALLIVLVQSFKSSHANPADTLKEE
jgi:ABC-type antimicrobial peptide transport system permease subunit